MICSKNLPELRPQLDKRFASVCKSRDQLGRRIFVFRAGKWNPDETTLDDIFRCNLYILQRLAMEPESQLNGIVAIVDMAGMPLSRARLFTADHAKKIAQLLNVIHSQNRI